MRRFDCRDSFERATESRAATRSFPPPAGSCPKNAAGVRFLLLKIKPCRAAFFRAAAAARVAARTAPKAITERENDAAHYTILQIKINSAYPTALYSSESSSPKTYFWINIALTMVTLL